MNAVSKTLDLVANVFNLFLGSPRQHGNDHKTLLKKKARLTGGLGDLWLLLSSPRPPVPKRKIGQEAKVKAKKAAKLSIRDFAWIAIRTAVT
jgi:hypothetical protein